MKKVIKKTIILIMLFFVITSIHTIYNTVLAANDNYSFDEFDNVEVTNKAGNAISKVSATVISVMRIVGTTIAVVMLLSIAIKYMIAAPGDRADMKKQALPYIVGAVLVFGVPNILGIIINIAGTAFKV